MNAGEARAPEFSFDCRKLPSYHPGHEVSGGITASERN